MGGAKLDKKTAHFLLIQVNTCLSVCASVVLDCIASYTVSVVLSTTALNISLREVVFIGDLFYWIALYCTVVMFIVPPLPCLKKKRCQADAIEALDGDFSPYCSVLIHLSPSGSES